MERLKVVSLFCGCGGADVGMLGGFTYLRKKYDFNPFEIVYANDIDPLAAAIFDRNFDIKCNVEDIRKIKASSIPEHDILMGGFPCQSFSIVAQNPPRLGHKDANGKLFFEICRILRNKKPKAFIAENVKGIISVNKGKTLPLIIKKFESCGYIVSWNLLNAADYGVPQRRERVFIVGIRKNIGRKFFPPEATHTNKDDSKLKKWVPLKKVILPPEKVAQRYFFSKRAHQGLIKSNKSMNKGRAQDIENVCNTVGAHLAKVSLNSTDPVLKINGLFRRFTPREVANIQSFPKSFKLVGSESAQYRALGNAIPPVVMWHIARQLIYILTEENVKDTRSWAEKRSYNMSKIRSKSTSIEEILASYLSDLQIQFERNVADLPGKPDFVLKTNHLALFCDSEFWHGKSYPESVNRIKTNKEFWQKKIGRNIQRDKSVNKELRKLGWKVIRIWERDLKEDCQKCLNRILKSIKKNWTNSNGVKNK